MRPDLSHLTQGQVIPMTDRNDVPLERFDIAVKGIESTLEEYESFQKAINSIPELVQIAEMFYDSLESTGINSIPFQIVKSTLDKIAIKNGN